MVKDIHYRPTKERIVPICDSQAVKQEQEEQDRQNAIKLQREIEEYQRNLEDSQYKPKPKTAMTHFMDSHYTQLMKESGFKPDYALERDNPDNEAAFAILRPNNSVKNFRQYVHPKPRPVAISRTETKATTKRTTESSPRKSPINNPQVKRRLLQNKSVAAVGKSERNFFNKRGALKTSLDTEVHRLETAH